MKLLSNDEIGDIKRSGYMNLSAKDLILLYDQSELAIKYKKALEFYENEDNHNFGDGKSTPKVQDDRGKIARKALI